MEDMRHNLIEAQEERSVLGENLSEAQNQIEEPMQLNTTGGSGGLARRQSLAPSLATFHTTTFKQMGAMEEAHKIEVERLEIETRERLDQLGSAGEEIGRLQVSC